jgi:hypothetical protein
MPPRPDNPKGFWESLAIVRLNDAILKDIGASWDQPGPFLSRGKTLAEAAELVTAYTLERFREQAVATLRQSFGTAPAIVLKDPRICLLLPLWARALTDLGYSCRFVLMYRNPLEVAVSLNKRNQILPRRATQLWLYYNLCCLQEFEKFPEKSRAVSYQTLLDDPIAAISHILDAETLNGSDSGTRDQIRDYIARADNHFPNTAANVLNSAHIPAAIKNTWHLLERWCEIEPRLRANTLAKISEDFNEAMLLAGPVVRPSAHIQAGDSAMRAAAGRGEGPALRERKTGVRIVHYHLFKNAGTSVDEMLKRNFGAQWVEKEFAAPQNRSNCDLVGEFLRERPELVALSSHTALLPTPKIDELILPIIFVRHPIIRISSAYAFERRQDAQTFSAVLAKETDFAGYVRGLLDRPEHRGAKSFQTYRLAFNEPESSDSELVRALRALSSLPLVGLVEAYESSVRQLEQLVKPYFPGFESVIVRKNVSKSRLSTIEEELRSIEHQLGTELYAELLENNRDDLELFSKVSQLYAVEA